MSIQRQALIWASVIAVFIALTWALKGILLPFVAGMAIAYFLDPLADRLEKYGLSRLAATAVITVFFLLVTVVLLIVLVPVLYNQLVALVEIMPRLLQRGQEWLITVGDGRLGRVLGVHGTDVEQAISDSLGGSFDWLMKFMSSLSSQGLQFVALL